VALGLAETGALGVLLGSVPEARLVAALVVWSQVWAVGYAVGPLVAGSAAQQWGFSASGFLPAALAATVGVLTLMVLRARRADGEVAEESVGAVTKVRVAGVRGTDSA
jgi:MFS family permease